MRDRSEGMVTATAPARTQHCKGHIGQFAACVSPVQCKARVVEDVHGLDDLEFWPVSLLSSGLDDLDSLLDSVVLMRHTRERVEGNLHAKVLHSEPPLLQPKSRKGD